MIESVSKPAVDNFQRYQRRMSIEAGEQGHVGQGRIGAVHCHDSGDWQTHSHKRLVSRGEWLGDIGEGRMMAPPGGEAPSDAD